VAERLYRSRDERIVGGVAGGIAENLDLDPTIVRIGWVLLTLVAPITPLFYFILLFVIPEEPEPAPGAPPTPTDLQPSASTTTLPASQPPDTLVADGAANQGARAADRQARRQERREVRATGRTGSGFGFPGGLVFGVVLILVGAWLLARRWLPQLDADAWTPLLIIGFGVGLIALAMRPGGRSAD
jgi:phage shock protein C